MKPYIITKNTILSFILFLISPLLSLPAIAYGFMRKNSKSLLFIAFFIGILSYLYIPVETNDKSRYLSLYLYFRTQPSFSLYIIEHSRHDFLYHFIIYVFARLNISVGFIFFFCTSISFLNIFLAFCRYFRNQLSSNKVFIGGIVILIVSLSLPSVFSGVRFFLASSFFIRALFGNEKKTEQYFCYLFSILIHFSFLYLILSVFLYYLFQKTNYAKYIFILSFVFVLMPSSMYDYLFSAISVLGGGFKDKSQQYLYGEDFLTGGLEDGSFAAKFKFYYASIWVFCAYIYVLCTQNMKSQIRTYLYLLFAIINVFYGSPTVFNRYMTLARLCFVFLIVEDFKNYKMYKTYIFFFIVFMGSFIIDLIILRYNLITSFFNNDAFLLYTIIMRDMSVIQNIQL